MSEKLKCRCGSDSTIVISQMDSILQRAACFECGRSGPWMPGSEAATAALDADRLAEEKAREALEAIKRHVESVGGTMAQMSAVHRIATEALALLEAR